LAIDAVTLVTTPLAAPTDMFEGFGVAAPELGIVMEALLAGVRLDTFELADPAAVA
jgi:hypothetical protein